MWICPTQYSKQLKKKRKRKFLCVSFCEKRKIRQCRQPQGRERQTGSATGYYPMKCSRQAASRLSIFLKSGFPFENIPSLPPCNKRELSTRIFHITRLLCLVYGIVFCLGREVIFLGLMSDWNISDASLGTEDLARMSAICAIKWCELHQNHRIWLENDIRESCFIVKKCFECHIRAVVLPWT